MSSRVRPGPLQEYLRSRGWQLEEASETRGVASYIKDGVTVDIPQRVDFADYARRVAEVIGLLAEMESRGPQLLIEDLLQPVGDALGVRIDSEGTRNGTLPLLESLRLREATKNLLLAAAHSELLPLDYFPRMSRAEATALIASVREGQNQRGSFVARFIVPIEPAIGEQLDALDAPFGRRVVSRLLSAVQSVQRVRALGAYEELLRMGRQGVSGNLLSALHSMSHVVGAGSLEFAVDWARNRPIPLAAPSRVLFPGESLEGLDAVADQLKSQAQTKGVSVEGFVIRLDRSDPDAPGQIVVVQDDEVKRVNVTLQDSDYTLAIQAHKLGQPVRVVGTLTKQGRTWTLTESTGLEVLPQDGDSAS